MPSNDHQSSASKRPQVSVEKKQQSSSSKRPESSAPAHTRSSLSSYTTAASHISDQDREGSPPKLNERIQEEPRGEEEPGEDVGDDTQKIETTRDDRRMKQYRAERQRINEDRAEQQRLRIQNAENRANLDVDVDRLALADKGDDEQNQSEHSSQEDSFDWTSSESGSPGRQSQSQQPSSPWQQWSHEGDTAFSDGAYPLRTPKPPQEPFAGAGSGSPSTPMLRAQGSPSTLLAHPRSSPASSFAHGLAGPSQIAEAILSSPFVPDKTVFPTVIITPETGFAQPRGNYLAQSFTMHVDGPIVTHEEPILHEWIPLPLSEALGMKLWFSPWAVYKNLYEYNYFVRMLSIDADFEGLRRQWGRNGDGWIQPASFKGGAMLVLENGKVLKEKHIEALVTYVDAFLPEVEQFFRGGVKNLKQLEQTAAATKEKLTPVAFAEFWFKYSRRRADITGDKSWLRVECPVEEKKWKDSIDLTGIVS